MKLHRRDAEIGQSTQRKKITLRFSAVLGVSAVKLLQE